MEEVDAIDNGISQYDGEAHYAMSTNLSARVGHLNPWWNNESQDTEVCSEKAVMKNRFYCIGFKLIINGPVLQEGFHKAIALVGAEFLDRLDYYQNAWLPARVVVEEAVKARYQVNRHVSIINQVHMKSISLLCVRCV